MADTDKLNQLLLKLVERQPKLFDISTTDGSRVAQSYLAEFDGNLIKKILIDRQLTTNKEEQNYVNFVDGGTLLHFLSFVGCADSCEFLLKQNAFPHATSKNGNSPLHAAVSNNQTEVIRVLRYHHADVYAENEFGKTSLTIANENGDDEAKEALLSVRFSSEEVETEFLQEKLPPLVEKVLSTKIDASEQEHCLMCLRAEIRVATSSMTSVPKPLKMLREFYQQLKDSYESMDTARTKSKKLLADIISVIAMTVDDQERVCLSYRLLGSQESVSSFGHPYIRRLCYQIPQEWSNDKPDDQLYQLVVDIVQYCLEHNAEAEACDLLMEMDCINEIVKYVTESIYERVCLYLTSCVKYVPEPEDSTILKTSLQIYQKFHQYPHALRLALILNDSDEIRRIFLECPDKLVQKQLAFMLGRQQVYLYLEEEDDCPDADDLHEIMANAHLNTNFLNLARELDIMEPKVPEDIYKTHLEHSRFSTAQPVDSARANLASSFVNGFVNCSFGVDKLLTEEGNKWLYKNKSFGMLSATASLGLVLLWDVEGGLTQIDKFLYSGEDYIKAGALLACGIVNSGVKNECDPAVALLSDYVLHESNTMRLGAVIGLGLAYGGSNRNDVLEMLSPVFSDPNSSFEVICLAALSSAMIVIGTCHSDLADTIISIMMNPDHESDLSTTHSRYLALALGLLYLGKQDAVDVCYAAIAVVPKPFCAFASVLLDICAYAGTGNVLKIQSLLHLCSEYYGEDKESEEKGEATSATKKPAAEDTEAASGATATEKTGKGEKGKDDKGGKKVVEPGSVDEPGAHQALAVLGIAIIAMGEDIGAEMALRTFNHLLRYGEPVIRRSVPLALALISTSNPELTILDTLSKFSHDSDSTVARNAVFAMGLLGSGTNNARLAGLLRNLAQFYHKDPLDLFMVRLAQGLTHLGKGTLTLNPFHSDRGLMTLVSIAGLLTVTIAMLDSSNSILGTGHYMLYYLTPAIQPRMLVTFGEALQPISVSVRVGQAVDVVGQAGKPKSITGFQTHTTPVLLAHGERAELASEEYVSLTPIMEGFVILKKNPAYIED
ncbi:PREDICTED: 26S proteasome non-ATPase regulatory subunit 2-like [Amphimedon queenslandica]|uniref:26S proteasome non-ATPase regulatory subunit 2 n=1 Tax=Amphimedon queenslandica TaxID=400682 RepID=A0A1X7VLT0_AMPQE|nr:PREDICTED: 26S proteasome non-ATPase regulatory subunit 2-like [Amphimedon queenslandica]|eukprot:XP_019864481.1 PREDICTED: 26S proteasome non-ATPase regulatory subunit 2-like [Amphimedon queenslandica]